MHVSTRSTTPSRKTERSAWFRRLTVAGTLFFLAKGLMWVAVTYWVLD